MPTPGERSTYYAVEREVETSLYLREVTTEQQLERGHRSWVIDCTFLPTQSHYVPPMMEILRLAELVDRISPERSLLVETTTGNAGAGLAWAAERLGYPALVFMPESLPETRVVGVKRYLPRDEFSGVRLTPSEGYVSAMVHELRSFLASHGRQYQSRELFLVNHSRRWVAVKMLEWMTHKCLQQLPSEAKITTVVPALGNGTSAMGMALGVRRSFPEARVAGIEPVEAPWFYVQKYGGGEFRDRFGRPPRFESHRLYGTGAWGVQFPNMKLNYIDEIHLVEERDWRSELDRLHQSGWTVGHSSAACQHVVEQISTKTRSSREGFLSIFYDTIDTYEEP